MLYFPVYLEYLMALEGNDTWLGSIEEYGSNFIRSEEIQDQGSRYIEMTPNHQTVKYIKTDCTLLVRTSTNSAYLYEIIPVKFSTTIDLLHGNFFCRVSGEETNIRSFLYYAIERSYLFMKQLSINYNLPLTNYMRSTGGADDCIYIEVNTEFKSVFTFKCSITDQYLSFRLLSVIGEQAHTYSEQYAAILDVLLACRDIMEDQIKYEKRASFRTANK